MKELPPLPLSIEQQTLMVLESIERHLREIALNTKPVKHKR